MFGITLVSGARREALAIENLYAGLSEKEISKADLPYCDCQVMLDRTYFLPLGDRSWPDDTLVEFEYMDGEPTAAPIPAQAPVAARNALNAITVGRSTRNDVLARLGSATTIGFDNGYGALVYQFPEDHPAKDRPVRKSEFVVLIAPSGIVTKTRLRAPPAAA